MGVGGWGGRVNRRCGVLIIIDSEVNHFIFDLECDIERIESLMDSGYLEKIGPGLIEKLKEMIQEIKQYYIATGSTVGERDISL